MISISDIHYTYPGGIRALDGVSIEVPEGCFMSVMGANGSGKSTLLKHINGLLKPEAGSVHVGGAMVNSRNFEAVNRRVGFVFQDPNDQIFATTAREDIMYGPYNLGLPQNEVQRRVQETAAQVGISDLLDRPIHHLSHGQKKRLSIAGVLAMNPDCLVLDEPTASLDPTGERKLMRILHGLNRRGMTVVMATHDVDLVPLYSERVCLLRDGRVAAEGGLREVFADRELIECCRLRLPRISYLFEAIPNVSELPLTIGMARRQLEQMMAQEEAGLSGDGGLMEVEGEKA